MPWLVGVLVLLWLAWGPAVLLLAAAALVVPRVRRWLQDRPLPTRATTLRGAVGVVALVAVVVAVPDGWLPLPPGPGAWVGPSYTGRPASAQPLTVADGAHPHRAADPRTRRGPLGLQPEVDTAWYGVERCGWLERVPGADLAALCTGRGGPRLRLVDASTLRPVDSVDLDPPPEDRGCEAAAAFVDDAGRVVVASGGREVVAVATAVGDHPGLDPVQRWDLKPWVPWGDCVVALAPGWSGRTWWVTAAGLVGTLDPAGDEVGVLDLGERVRHGLTTDASGAYVVSDDAVRRLEVGPDGVPHEAWRSDQEGDAGSAPALLDGGALAVTDPAGDRLDVRFLDRATGRELCRQSVFAAGEASTRSDLAALGRGVVVTNNHDWSSPASTPLGFTSDPGIARVDLVDGGCVVRWTSDAVSPSSGAVVSLPTGLVYAWTKRPSLSGVGEWYLSAIDADTGRGKWSVRTGTGMIADSAGSRLALADGAAWLGTGLGLVRVRDRA